MHGSPEGACGSVGGSEALRVSAHFVHNITNGLLRGCDSISDGSGTVDSSFELGNDISDELVRVSSGAGGC